VTDILESSEIVDPLVVDHPSALLPPSSHDPLTMRNVALRSDQIGWDNTDVRTNQCVVGVTYLREEALALTQAYNLAHCDEPVAAAQQTEQPVLPAIEAQQAEPMPMHHAAAFLAADVEERWAQLPGIDP
jgi:hypothetical protein